MTCVCNTRGIDCYPMCALTQAQYVYKVVRMDQKRENT